MIDDSSRHYDWKAAKMMVNSAYISLSNISDVMEKTFSWFDVPWTTMRRAWLSWSAVMTVWLGDLHPGLAILIHMMYWPVNVICIITDRLRLRWILIVITITLAAIFQVSWIKCDVLSRYLGSPTHTEGDSPIHKLCEATMQSCKKTAQWTEHS